LAIYARISVIHAIICAIEAKKKVVKSLSGNHDKVFVICQFDHPDFKRVSHFLN